MSHAKHRKVTFALVSDSVVLKLETVIVLNQVMHKCSIVDDRIFAAKILHEAFE